MSWNDLYSLSNLLALAGWIILIAAPRNWTWLGLLPRYIIPIVLSLCYVLIMTLNLAGTEGGFDTIANVRSLFQYDSLLVAGWQHYLIFDLLIGCWLASSMDDLKIHRLIQTPILIATFILGPLGWLAGMTTITLSKRKRLG